MDRKRTTTWTDFIRAHMSVLAGTDFFSVEVLTLRGLVTYYVLFFMPQSPIPLWAGTEGSSSKAGGDLTHSSGKGLQYVPKMVQFFVCVPIQR